MDLFTYLMAKNGHNTSIHEDLFSYLLGKSQSGGGEIKTASGVTINIPDAKKLVSFMMTKESTQDGTPNPDYPQEVKTVKGYRNLLNVNSEYIKRNNNGSMTISDNVITLTNNKTTQNAYGWIIPVEINKEITISFSDINPIVTYATVYYAFIQEPISSITDLSLGYVVDKTQKYATVTSTTNYLLVYIRVPQTTFTVTGLMVNYSEEKLPYVPYGNNYVNVAVNDGTNTNNYPIPLNNNEIVGIGDYKDELIVDKSGHVFINKKTGKFVFNGQEDWALSGNQPVNGIKFYYSKIFNNIISGQINTHITLCNYFKAITVDDYTNANLTGICMFRGTSAGGIDVCILNTSITLNDFKSLLANNNMYIYQALATPELIDLQTTVDLKLFKGVNNVSNSEDGYMTIEYH